MRSTITGAQTVIQLLKGVHKNDKCHKILEQFDKMNKKRQNEFVNFHVKSFEMLNTLH